MTARPPKVHRIGDLSPGIDAGKYITDFFEAAGENTTVLLEPYATYILQTRVILNQNNQELATYGYPADNEAKAKLFTRGVDSIAIESKDKANIVIRCLYIDGCRREFGAKGRGGLLEVGGWKAKNYTVDGCVLKDPRGWTALHSIDGCQGAIITNNLVGPCGSQKQWADGMSIACRNGIIANNIITDATDGAIVLFCAPGSTVISNTIIARTQSALGGINLVDHGPFEGNYEGIRVIANTIKTEGGAFIHLGIGIGPNTWSDVHDKQNYGGHVLANIIGPGRFGYGIAAGGCKDFTVLQNRVAADTIFSGSTDRISEVTPPTPFLKKNHHLTTGYFQSEFLEGPVRYLIGVRDEPGSKMEFHAKALSWTAGRDAPPGARSNAEMQNAVFELSEEGRLLVWDPKIRGRVLWDSKSGHNRRTDDSGATLLLGEKTARLQIRSGSGQVLWDPMSYLRSINYECPDCDPVLYLADTVPYLQVKHNRNILYSSNYTWPTFELFAGRFVALLSDGNEPPIIPHEHRPGQISQALSDLHINEDHTSQSKRLSWLYLDPDTTQLVLHSSTHPQKVEEAEVIWRSPNWKKVKSTPDAPGHANLQSDGNFVIYGSHCGAVWATGTNAEHRRATSIAMSQDGLELRDAKGKAVWSSRHSN